MLHADKDSDFVTIRQKITKEKATGPNLPYRRMVCRQYALRAQKRPSTRRASAIERPLGNPYLTPSAYKRKAESVIFSLHLKFLI